MPKFIVLIRELGRYPTHGELRMRERADPEFPTHGVFARLGSKQDLVRKVVAYCAGHPGNDDVASICAPLVRAELLSPEESTPQSPDGFVYLIKSGKFYKIGRSNAAGRREREIALQLPEKATTVHTIRTDDPPGIEAYWHQRFAEKRLNGEWFELTAADVKAFKRRKFM